MNKAFLYRVEDTDSFMILATVADCESAIARHRRPDGTIPHAELVATVEDPVIVSALADRREVSQ